PWPAWSVPRIRSPWWVPPTTASSPTTRSRSDDKGAGVKILHTSDWHIGKVLKGQPRADEQTAALAALIEVAHAEQPDLVIVAGDLFDHGMPTPEARKVVIRALSALRKTGAEV